MVVDFNFNDFAEINRFSNIRQRDFLWRGDDNGLGIGNGLSNRQRFIARARRCINNQKI